MSRQQANTNPKLVKLEKLLVKAFQEEPESRAMIFVRTRDLAAALQHWMLRTPALYWLKPGKMVGAGASVDSGGQSSKYFLPLLSGLPFRLPALPVMSVCLCLPARDACLSLSACP